MFLIYSLNELLTYRVYVYISRYHPSQSISIHEPRQGVVEETRYCVMTRAWCAITNGGARFLA